jgi:asparagine synthase (glutamine-hydrolysing)
MCGIVGLSSSNLGGNPALALSRIEHRGPDGTGAFQSRAMDCWLGHRRLAIIDTSAAAHQPMVSKCGRFVIAYNGEIYNFRELRAQLKAEGMNFRSTSDTEVLLELFALRGLACLSELNGMYAFAVYDTLREYLYLCRDPNGIKPLYFFNVDGAFGFASEIKALLPLMTRAPTLDARAINRYLSYMWCPGEGTPFQEVRKVRPGEMLVVCRGNVISRQRFQYGPDERTEVVDAASFRCELEKAVRRQLIADVPVGSFLSGGLDSSSVVAFAVRHNPEIVCFTIEQDGQEDTGVQSDLPFAVTVAKHLNVRLESVKLRSQQMCDELPGIIGQLDEPQTDPAALATQIIARRARALGVKVLLSGVGGDDILAGYRRHTALYWLELFGPVPSGIGAVMRHALRYLDHRRTLVRQLARIAERAGSSRRDQLVGLFAWNGRGVTESLFTDRMRQQLLHCQADQPFTEFLERLPLNEHLVKQCLALEQEYYLPDHNLAYADKMSMAEGVEIRVPLLDREIVRICRAQPGGRLMRRGVPKALLKDAMRGILPDQVINRQKVGFGAPVRRWIANELREVVHDCLSPTRLRNRGLFEPGCVAELIDRNEHGHVDGAYLILALVCLELWMRQFMDGSYAWAKSA